MTIETSIRSRRELASALAQYMNTRAVYLGPPTFAYQIGDIHRLCPRCGRDTMKQPLNTNALSRHTDLYICDACGTEEAILDYMHAPLPLASWAALLQKR